MPRTTKQLLDEGSQRLRRIGIENPRLAAEIILRAILKLRRIDLYLQHDREVGAAAEAEYRDKIGRKINREPLQYIVGETEWFGLTFKCDRRAMVPRPETEIVVERALEMIDQTTAPAVVDIGTGTGCIAIAVAAARPDACVLATDISGEALSLARENVTSHSLAGRVELRQGDLFRALTPSSLFDLIISNPPYVRTSEYQHLMPEVREYEPEGALVAGSDGLAVIRELVRSAPEFLKADGLLVLEFGNDHLTPVTELVEETSTFAVTEAIVDYNHLDRGIVLKKK